MLAPGAGTLPRGHILVEPYVYDVMTYGGYDRNGRLQPATHQNGFGNLTYIIYGLVNRFSVGLIPTFGYDKVSSGPSSSNIGMGDLGVLAQYRITPDSWLAKASIAVQETFPTGAYENLGSNPNNGFGSGVYSTKIISVYANLSVDAERTNLALATESFGIVFEPRERVWCQRLRNRHRFQRHRSSG